MKIQIKLKCTKCKEYFVQFVLQGTKKEELKEKCTNCSTMSEIVKQFLTRDGA